MGVKKLKTWLRALASSFSWNVLKTLKIKGALWIKNKARYLPLLSLLLLFYSHKNCTIYLLLYMIKKNSISLPTSPSSSHRWCFCLFMLNEIDKDSSPLHVYNTGKFLLLLLLLSNSKTILDIDVLLLIKYVCPGKM